MIQYIRRARHQESKGKNTTWFLKTSASMKRCSLIQGLSAFPILINPRKLLHTRKQRLRCNNDLPILLVQLRGQHIFTK